MRKLLALAIVAAVLASVAIAGAIGVYLVERSANADLREEVTALQSQLDASSTDGASAAEEIGALNDTVSALTDTVNDLQSNVDASSTTSKKLTRQLRDLNDCFIEVARQVQGGLEVSFRTASPYAGLSEPCSNFVYSTSPPLD